MTTATQPHAGFTALPLLAHERLPEEVASIPAFAALAKRHSEVQATALEAMEEFKRADRAASLAAETDVETAVSALVEGVELKGKLQESVAIANAEKAHKAAVAAILASNRLLSQLIEKLCGTEGAEAFAHFAGEARALRAAEARRLDAVEAGVLEAHAAQSIADWIDTVRNKKRDKMRRPGLPTIRRTPKPIHMRLNDPSARDLVAALRLWTAEDREAA